MFWHSSVGRLRHGCCFMYSTIWVCLGEVLTNIYKEAHGEPLHACLTCCSFSQKFFLQWTWVFEVKMLFSMTSLPLKTLDSTQTLPQLALVLHTWVFHFKILVSVAPHFSRGGLRICPWGCVHHWVCIKRAEMFWPLLYHLPWENQWLAVLRFNHILSVVGSTFRYFSILQQ